MMHVFYKEVNRFDKVEIEALLTTCEGPCVSIFLPTSSSERHEIEAEPLVLRNLLDQATVQLAAQGMSTADIEHLLAPITAVAAPNQEFWSYQRKGLAFFVAPTLCLVYRLPLTPPELVVVDQRFYIRPLLPIIDGDECFYVLALSQNAVRLFQGTHCQMRELELMNAPTTPAEVLRDDEVEGRLQLHSTGRSAVQGRHPAVFHAQRLSGDERILHTNRLHLFHAVEREVTARLARQRAPLLLAGVDVDQELYRQANRYAFLMERGIPGNPNRLSLDGLHNVAWKIVASYFQQTRDQAINQYRQLVGKGDGHTVHEIKKVVLAAVYHQVDTIFVLPTCQIWGKFISEGHQVVVHKMAEPGDEELVNLAVIHTLHNHGAAYLVAPEQLPSVTPVAAILRN